MMLPPIRVGQRGVNGVKGVNGGNCEMGINGKDVMDAAHMLF